MLGQSKVALSIGDLLGAYFLMQHSCVVDLQNMSLLAREKAVGFISQSGNKEDLPRHAISCHVTFSDTINCIVKCSYLFL